MSARRGFAAPLSLLGALALVSSALVLAGPRARAETRAGKGGGSAVAPRPKRVLLTAFEPFGGSPVNNSEAVARAAARTIGASLPGTEVRICVLPVVYDGGAALARRCLETMKPKPDLVISLGEGDCTFRLETRAHNRDHTPGFADNAGVIRENRRILGGDGDGGVEQLGFELPLSRMFCAIPKPLRSRVSVSYSPGYYVCNNAAFLLASHLVPTGIPYGFIHVPHTRCEKGAQDPEINGGMLARAVVAALGAEGKPRRLPVSKEEAQASFAAARGSCEIDFFSRLRKRYF